MAKLWRRAPAADPTANAVIQELKKYYNTKQPNANIIAPFKLNNFGNFDQAVWKYMVTLREQGIHNRLAKRINNAPNVKGLANIRPVIDNHSISNNLKQSLRQRLSARQIALSQGLINTPLNGIQNLRGYRNNLARMWANLSRNDKQALQEKYTRRIINVNSKLTAANKMTRRNALIATKNKVKNELVVSKNTLSKNNRNFLGTLPNNQNAATRLKQNSARRLLRQIPNNSNKNKSIQNIMQRIDRIVASSGLPANNANVNAARSRSSVRQIANNRPRQNESVVIIVPVLGSPNGKTTKIVKNGSKWRFVNSVPYYLNGANSNDPKVYLTYGQRPGGKFLGFI